MDWGEQGYEAKSKKKNGEELACKDLSVVGQRSVNQ